MKLWFLLALAVRGSSASESTSTPFDALTSSFNTLFTTPTEACTGDSTTQLSLKSALTDARRSIIGWK